MDLILKTKKHACFRDKYNGEASNSKLFWKAMNELASVQSNKSTYFPIAPLHNRKPF